jgi:hypothetical protein
MSWTTPENSGQFFVVLVSVLPMAFLWRHPKSQYWIARFYDGNGERRNRSTDAQSGRRLKSWLMLSRKPRTASERRRKRGA